MELPLSDSDLDSALRSSFIGEPGNVSSSDDYKYYYYSDSDSDYCTTSTGQEWLAILILCGLILGLITSIVYLIVTVPHCNTLALSFPFLNSFVLASFMNLLSGGIFDIMTLSSHCWYRGKVLCKVLPTIVNASDNAMIYFLVATIYQQSHPHVRSFLSKNEKFRKRTTVIILWLVTMLLFIPEVLTWDIIELSSNSFSCSLNASHPLQYIYSLTEFFLCFGQIVMLLVLMLMYAFAAVLLRLGLLTTNQAPEESHSRNGENDLQEGTESQRPQITGTSIAIGSVFCVTQTAYKVSYLLYGLFGVFSNNLFTFIVILNPIPSIVAPVLVLLTSPIHKRRLKETCQFIASCNASRSVKKRSLPREENEDRLQEVGVELLEQ